MTQSSRLHGSLYAYSMIIHSWRKAFLRQFSHCEWFSRYNEANCAGSERDENLCFSNERSEAAKAPPRLMDSRKQLIIIVMRGEERGGGDHQDWAGQDNRP